MTAVEDRISLGIDCADPLHVIGELRRMSTSHPWRERITELLMLALYRSGRQAEAIEAYNQARWRLANDLRPPNDHHPQVSTIPPTLPSATRPPDAQLDARASPAPKPSKYQVARSNEA